jgi:hypothetical protein
VELDGLDAADCGGLARNERRMADQERKAPPGQEAPGSTRGVLALESELTTVGDFGRGGSERCATADTFACAAVSAAAAVVMAVASGVVVPVA